MSLSNITVIFIKLVDRRLPVNEPLIKLNPIMKLMGNLIVSVAIRFTFLLFLLFWMPIIKSKNKEVLNININNIFFKEYIVKNN